MKTDKKEVIERENKTKLNWYLVQRRSFNGVADLPRTAAVSKPDKWPISPKYAN